MELVVYNFWGTKGYQLNTNIVLENHYMLIGKHIFVIFLSFFIMRNFRGTWSEKVWELTKTPLRGTDEDPIKRD